MDYAIPLTPVSAVKRMADTSTFTPEEKAEILVDPYDKAMKYSNGVIWAVCGVIAIAGLVNLIMTFRRLCTQNHISSPKPPIRLIAAFRYLSSRPTKSFTRYLKFPTRGVVFLISVFWVFVLVWAFAVQPYYRSHWNVGSPPLAIRTGMMALGIFPFILAFGSKFNLVTFITGYSHEKLQVFHQWFSHLFLVLSFLHTFPFVMAGREKKPGNKMGLSYIGYSWYIHKVYYWTGCIMLVALVWLCWASFTPLRNRWYEMFKYTHMAAAIVFSAFFYLHCNALLTSWYYLYATLALYGISFVMRVGLMIFRNGRAIPRAFIDVLPGNAIRLSIPTSHHRWTAGQHFFLNFVQVRPFESHPYTISNDMEEHEDARRLVIVLKTDLKGGIGERLKKIAEKNPLGSTPVVLDGPYGGLGGGSDLRVNETVVLIAGGSGASFIMALLEKILEGLKTRDERVRVRKVVVHWMIKHQESSAWFEDHVRACLKGIPTGLVEMNMHITGNEGEGEEEVTGKNGGVDDHEDKSMGLNTEVVELHTMNTNALPVAATSGTSPWTVTRSRPPISSLILDLLSTVPSETSVGIGSCGPTSLTDTVRTAVAKRQKMIMLGKTGGKGTEDVSLYTEEFDW